MGRSEIEKTAGISHPLPPCLNNCSQRGHYNEARNHDATLSLHYVNRSYWKGVRIAWKATCCLRLPYHLWITR